MLKERQVTDRFQIAAEHAASSVATSVWLNMAATERSDAIYRELRTLDEEALDMAQSTSTQS